MAWARMYDKPAIYWINLERSTARRARMEQRLEARGLRHRRIVAIDGRDEAATAAALRCRPPTLTEAACIASHLRAVKTAFEAGDELALVLEDDVTFEPLDAWPGGLQAVLGALPPRFGLCALCIAQTPRELDRLFRRQPLVVPLGRRQSFWSTGATLYDRAGLSCFMQRYDRGAFFDIREFRAGRHDAYQVFMRTVQLEPGLAGPFVARIPLFLYEGADSDIHPHHLDEHRVALGYLREQLPALLAGTYCSPFTWRARLSRLRARLATAAAE